MTSHPMNETSCRRCRLPMSTGILVRGSRSEICYDGTTHVAELSIALCERCGLLFDAWLREVEDAPVAPA